MGSGHNGLEKGDDEDDDDDDDDEDDEDNVETDEKPIVPVGGEERHKVVVPSSGKSDISTDETPDEGDEEDLITTIGNPDDIPSKLKYIYFRYDTMRDLKQIRQKNYAKNFPQKKKYKSITFYVKFIHFIFPHLIFLYCIIQTVFDQKENYTDASKKWIFFSQFKLFKISNAIFFAPSDIIFYFVVTFNFSSFTFLWVNSREKD